MGWRWLLDGLDTIIFEHIYGWHWKAICEILWVEQYYRSIGLSKGDFHGKSCSHHWKVVRPGLHCSHKKRISTGSFMVAGSYFLQPHHTYYIIRYEELAFIQSLLRWEIIMLLILTTSHLRLGEWTFWMREWEGITKKNKTEMPRKEDFIQIREAWVFQSTIRLILD